MNSATGTFRLSSHATGSGVGSISKFYKAKLLMPIIVRCFFVVLFFVFIVSTGFLLTHVFAKLV